MLALKISHDLEDGELIDIYIYIKSPLIFKTICSEKYIKMDTKSFRQALKEEFERKDLAVQGGKLFVDAFSPISKGITR